MLAKAGFRITKWLSNDERILASLLEKELAKSVQAHSIDSSLQEPSAWCCVERSVRWVSFHCFSRYEAKNSARSPVSYEFAIRLTGAGCSCCTGSVLSIAACANRSWNGMRRCPRRICTGGKSSCQVCPSWATCHFLVVSIWTRMKICRNVSCTFCWCFNNRLWCRVLPASCFFVWYGGLLLALYNCSSLVAPGLSLYNSWFVLSSGCVPCRSSAHRGPGKKAAVPLYKVLVKPGQESW